MQKRDAAAFLAGVSRTEGSQASAPTNLHVISGEVGTRSEDGKTTVAIDGLVFSEADDQYVEMDTLGGLEEGDVATIILTGEDGHAMTPLAIGAPGSVDIIRDTAEAADSKSDAAQELAQAAKDVADAVGQHFWTDENGIHVTEVTQDEWNDVDGTDYHSKANTLINSIGQLFRDGLNNLLAILPSGIAIYDGNGNAASNIIARILGSGVQIGRDSEMHVSIDSDSVDVLKGTNNRQLITMRDSGDAGYVGATYFDEDGYEHHGAGTIVEADTDGSRMIVEINAEYNLSDIDINNFNGRTDMNINRMDSIRFSDPYDSSLTTYLQLGNPTRYQNYGEYAITTAGIDTLHNGPRVTIPAGYYMFVGQWTFNSASASGDRNMQVGFRSGASGSLWGERVRIRQSSGNFNALNVSALREFTSETTVYLAGSASITSGKAGCYITAVRLN